MIKIAFLFLCAFLLGITIGILTSCTYSITMVHTEGVASDVVDETQSAEPDVKGELNIPAKVI